MPEVQAAAVTAAALADLDVDVVHDHSLAGPLLARTRDVPTVVTLHGPSTGPNGKYFETLGDTVDIVAISGAQQRLNPRLNWAGVVHNGIDVAPFPFSDRKEDFDGQWQEVPDVEPYKNSYRTGWELFLRHVARGLPFPSPLLEGAKGIQLVDACYRSHAERRWIDLRPLAVS